MRYQWLSKYGCVANNEYKEETKSQCVVTREAATVNIYFKLSRAAVITSILSSACIDNKCNVLIHKVQCLLKTGNNCY